MLRPVGCPTCRNPKGGTTPGSVESRGSRRCWPSPPARSCSSGGRSTSPSSGGYGLVGARGRVAGRRQPPRHGAGVRGGRGVLSLVVRQHAGRLRPVPGDFQDGRPVDFVYLDVNPAFERVTGLMDVVGRRVTEVIPRIRDTNPELFEIYGRGRGPPRSPGALRVGLHRRRDRAPRDARAGPPLPPETVHAGNARGQGARGARRAGLRGPPEGWSAAQHRYLGSAGRAGLSIAGGEGTTSSRVTISSRSARRRSCRSRRRQE